MDVLLPKCTLMNLSINSLEPFQGTAKTHTPEQLAQLRSSIIEEGLLQPLTAWVAPGSTTYKLIDGHGRFTVLQELLGEDSKVPVVVLECKTLDMAREILLQALSTYGRISAEGVAEFARGLVTKAPVVQRQLIKKHLSNDSISKVEYKQQRNKSNTSTCTSTSVTNSKSTVQPVVAPITEATSVKQIAQEHRLIVTVRAEELERLRATLESVPYILKVEDYVG